MGTCVVDLKVKCPSWLGAEKLTDLKQKPKSLLDTPGKVNNLWVMKTESISLNSRGPVQEKNLMSARSVEKPSVNIRTS